MATRLDELYADDLYAWSIDQATALRRLAETRPNEEIDWPHVIEEIEDLGKDRRDAVRSQVRRVIEHLLKLEHSRARDPRHGWLNSIDDAREQIGDRLSRTLERDIADQLPVLYRQVRRRVTRDLTAYGEADAAAALPPVCPYSVPQILDEDWYPPPALTGCPPAS